MIGGKNIIEIMLELSKMNNDEIMNKDGDIYQIDQFDW